MSEVAEKSFDGVPSTEIPLAPSGTPYNRVRIEAPRHQPRYSEIRTGIVREEVPGCFRFQKPDRTPPRRQQPPAQKSQAEIIADLQDQVATLTAKVEELSAGKSGRPAGGGAASRPQR